MKIYALTDLGKRLARSVNNEDTPAWKIVHHLDATGYQTPDQVSSSTGIPEGEVAGVLARLRRKKVVTEVTQQGGF